MKIGFQHLEMVFLILGLMVWEGSAHAMCVQVDSDVGFEIDFECGFACGERMHILAGKHWCYDEDDGGKVEINAYPGDYGNGKHRSFFGRVGNINVPHKGKVIISGKNGNYKACSYFKNGGKKTCTSLDI